MLKILGSITNRIIKYYQPEKIILFGSYGKKTFRKGGDIDIFIIKETKKRPAERQMEVERILSNRILPLDLMVYTPDEVRFLYSIGSPFISDIMEKGRLLYMRKVRAWHGLTEAIWKPRFVPNARRDEGAYLVKYVTEEQQRSRRKDGLPRRGWPILPWLVAYPRLRTIQVRRTAVRLEPNQNRLSQIASVSPCQALAESWLKDAREELDSANILYENGIYKGACYHSQQTVEKVLKALILEKGKRPGRIHDVVDLLNKTTKLGLNTGLIMDDAIFLNSIYRGRYPTEEGLLPYGEPTRADAERAVSAAKLLIESLTQIVGASIK